MEILAKEIACLGLLLRKTEYYTSQILGRLWEATDVCPGRGRDLRRDEGKTGRNLVLGQVFPAR